MKIFVFLIAYFCIPPPLSFSQQKNDALSPKSKEPSISVISKVEKNKISLRWSPSEYYLWDYANKYGYIIERYTLKSGKTKIKNIDSTKVLLTASPLRPLSEVAWDSIKKIVPMAGVLQGLLYERDSSKKTNDIASAIQQKENWEVRFAYSLLVCDRSPIIAKAAGLFFEDSNIIESNQYLYKISIADSMATNKTSYQNAGTIINAKELTYLLSPMQLKITNKELQITMEWLHRFSKNMYTSYYIEKSTDSIHFKRILAEPYTYNTDKKNDEYFYFTDSVYHYDSSYFYRVQGLSSFGDLGPYSKVKKIIVLQPIGRPFLYEGKVIENKITKISWRLSPDGIQQIKGFEIWRSENPSGGYEKITKVLLPKNSLDFIDVNPRPVSYYKVKAIGIKQGQGATSFPYLLMLEDKQAPEPPKIIEGFCNQNGQIFIKWRANTENDLKGYKITKVFNKDGEFIFASPLILTDTFFNDSVSPISLTKHIYYKVAAVDLHFNQSLFNDTPFKILLPDLIAPVPPSFLESDIQKNKVILQWKNSSSDDIYSSALYRFCVENTADSVLIKRWHKDSASLVTHWIDSLNDSLLQKRFFYKLIVRDSVGNSSFDKTLSYLYEPGTRPPITKFFADKNKNTGTISLSWNYDVSGVKYFYIYKASDYFKYTLEAKLPKDVLTYSVESPSSKDNLMKFIIKAEFENGIFSEMSQALIVQ